MKRPTINSIRKRQAIAARKAGQEPQKSANFGRCHAVEADFDETDYRGLFLQSNGLPSTQYVAFKDEG
jgi:hypothetical protein